tara:strand:+ start:1028 stop:1324 length:297 start_codon:yes stop_codon:yes gene_type:complete
MGNTIVLKEDLLRNYIDLENLIVCWVQSGCGSCKKVIPLLFKLDDKYTVVITDGEIHTQSLQYYPNNIPTYYPSILLFNKGKFVKVLTTDDIKEIQLY